MPDLILAIRPILLFPGLLVAFQFSVLAEPINVRDFGAKGDALSDDTEAIRKAFSSSREVYFPAGVYVLTDGIDLPESAILSGDGSPKLGTFPIWDDDKRFLTPELKDQLPGTTLLFRGEGKKSLESGRSDAFQSLRYGLKTATGLPYQIRDLAIVLDMTVKEGKKATTPETDQRADYDVGLLVDDSPGGTLRDVSIFGYWKRAGLCLLSRGEGSNPDYNTFWNCSFAGDYGVALLGQDEPSGPGLSGTQFYGCNLFSKDHHSRKGNDWGSGALFIDGGTDGVHADINGHYFFGGCVRTYNNVAVRLNRASNIAFHSVVFEVPGWDGENSEGADKTGQIVGTEHTRDVQFYGCRMHNLGLDELAQTMADGAVTVVGGMREGVTVQAGQSLMRLRAPTDGDPLIQMSRSSDSINDGWTMRLDVSQDSDLVLRYDNRAMATLSARGELRVNEVATRSVRLAKPERVTLEGSTATISQGRCQLFSKGQAQLSSLKGGSEGESVILQLAVDSQPVEIVPSEQLRLPKPFLMDHPDETLVLLRSGDRWLELSRASY